MKGLRSHEMLRFENFLWKYSNPAECLEDWAEETTEALFKLAEVSNVPAHLITLPLSPEILMWVEDMHEFYRTPISERGENETVLDFYSGAKLTEPELIWVATHIQKDLIPAY